MSVKVYHLVCINYLVTPPSQGEGGSQANVTPYVTFSSQTIFPWTDISSDKKIREQVYNEDDGDFDVGQQDIYILQGRFTNGFLNYHT